MLRAIAILFSSKYWSASNTLRKISPVKICCTIISFTSAFVTSGLIEFLQISKSSWCAITKSLLKVWSLSIKFCSFPTKPSIIFFKILATFPTSFLNNSTAILKSVASFLSKFTNFSSNVFNAFASVISQVSRTSP